MNCRLCNAEECIHVCSDLHRSFFHCVRCGLIFVPASDHLSLSDEKARYALHDNDAGHEGYLRFLSEMADSVIEHSSPNAHILDFGCGKEAVLSSILRARGFDCTPYDPLYEIGPSALARQYDAVVLCEVIEHLRELPHEVAIVKQVLKPTGKVFIRTRLYPSLPEFSKWWYKEDPTHVNFFSRPSMELLASMMGLTMEDTEKPDIFIMQG
jgi:hypothetical protein